jgi:hypothetical protein
LLTMTRPKRNAQVKAHITDDMRQQLELFVAEEGNVVSMSDYIFGVLEDHIAFKAIRIHRQKLGKRTGTQ